MNNCNSLFMGSIIVGVIAFVVGTFVRSAGFLTGYTGYSGATFQGNQVCIEATLGQDWIYGL